MVHNAIDVKVTSWFATIYKDFLKFCESQCEYGPKIREYATNFNDKYLKYRAENGLEPIGVQLVTTMMKMSGHLVRDRCYNIKVKNS